MNTENLTLEQKQELLDKLNRELGQDKQEKKEVYQTVKLDFIKRIKDRVYKYLNDGLEFKKWLRTEAEAFFAIMKDYGHVKRDDQLGFKIDDGDFRFQVKGNRVKGFDERADMAAARLTEFLQGWVVTAEKGTANPMYKLAMRMIQRNEDGDLDYKSISYLFEVESDFNDPEYSEIMELFRESNVVEKTAIHFYFEKKDELNRWRKIEPSFNKM